MALLSAIMYEDYVTRTRKDRNKNGGGLIEYVRKGIVCKKLINLCGTKK